MKFAASSSSLALLLGATFVTSTQAQAQEAPTSRSAPPTDSARAADEQSRVIVEGTRPEAVTEIDRKTYNISKDPKAQSGSAVDILGTLPSVTVSTSGGIQLLGNLAATIMIDGKPPLNASQTLRSLLASEIDSIEVMTNPSAQFASDGAGGIINIVTKRRKGPGLSGSAQAGADSLGSALVSLAPTIVLEDWSFGANAQYSRDESVRKATRRTELIDLGEATSESRRTETSSDTMSLKLSATYRPSEDSSYSFSWNGLDNRSESAERNVVDSTRLGRPSYTELVTTPSRLRMQDVSFGYELSGATPNDSLTISAGLQSSDWRIPSSIRDDFNDPGVSGDLYATNSDTVSQTANAKLDVKRGLFGTNILSWGASWDREIDKARSVIDPLSPDSDSLPAVNHTLKGRRDVGAAYLTFQFPFADWTLLPGFRVENEDLQIAGQPQSSRDSVDVFPSLHVSRDLTASLQLDFSYARRIDRPGLSDLDPTPIYTGTTQGSVGNPDLKPVKVTAVEAGATYTVGKSEVAATVYSRTSDGVWTSFAFETADDVVLFTTVNAGKDVSSGAEVSYRSQLGDHWKYSVAADLYAREIDVADGGASRRESSFAYSGSSKLEYRWREEGADEDNQVELAARYYGPQRSFQAKRSGFWFADFTWRRPLTRKAAIVFTASDIFSTADTRARYVSDEFIDETLNLSRPVRLKLSLTYKLGASD